MKLTDLQKEVSPVWEEKGYEVLKYDREAVKQKTKEAPTWVHFGAGNIFRAFPAEILQRVLNQGEYDRGIVVAESFDHEIISKAYKPYDCLSLSVVLKANGTIEKKIVRDAFSCLLPESVAQRQKEQFSDGVGYSWIDTLKEITSQAVSDEQMAHASERFPINPPMNKEEYYYRSIFEEYFPSDSAARSVPSVPSVACSTAEALAWDTSFKGQNEPSGRAVNGIHEDAYSKTEI